MHWEQRGKRGPQLPWDPTACLSAHILYVVSQHLKNVIPSSSTVVARSWCSTVLTLWPAQKNKTIDSVGLSSRFPLQAEHVLSSWSSRKSSFDPPCFHPVLCVIWYNLTRYVTALLREWTTLNVSFSVFTQGEEKWKEGGARREDWRNKRLSSSLCPWFLHIHLSVLPDFSPSLSLPLSLSMT